MVADDNVLNFMCQTALPVDAHIAIDDKTGTVAPGALWYEESVPPETIFYGVMGVDRSYDGRDKKADELSDLLCKQAPKCFQVGGKSTTGKGFVQLSFASLLKN